MKCVSTLPNDQKGEIHRTEFVMNVNCIDKVNNELDECKCDL